jgi:SanA protein
VIFFAEGKIYYDVELLPEKKVALVLGTSKYVAGNVGLINLFYKKRLEAANELFDSGNIEKFILSGTNDSLYYNEPQTMKIDLMKMGVPENKIYLDYAGFRTLDSVLRAREIFSQSDFIIVSQKFHLQRALLIAGVNGIEAVGYAAQDPSFLLASPTYARELLSRVKLFFDIAIKKEATVYGEKVFIK